MYKKVTVDNYILYFDTDEIYREAKEKSNNMESLQCLISLSSHVILNVPGKGEILLKSRDGITLEEMLDSHNSVS